MFKALALFFNLLVLIVVLKMFAPGLSEALVELMTNVVVITNEAVASLAEQSQQGTYQDY